MFFHLGAELRKVVDCTLAMRSSDDVGQVEPEVSCDLAPYCFDCCSKGAVVEVSN